MKYAEVCAGIYQIGGSGFSSSNDCCVYLLDGGGKYAMIDCGTGAATGKILKHLTSLAVNPKEMLFVVLTHGHIDHIGGLGEILQAFPQAKTVAHRLELEAIEKGSAQLTAANWYGIKYSGVPVDLVLEGSRQVLTVGAMKLHCLHTPGHTPGSIALYLDWKGQRILFGQDIHGPFNKQWGSDLELWEQSMKRLLALKADVLCEGHFGIIKTKNAVQNFIERYVEHYA